MFKPKEIAGKSSGVVGDVRHVRVGDPLQARAAYLDIIEMIFFA
jgi:hypothetical protein